MVIERVHGLQATSLSLNDRFTLLATNVPVHRVPRARPRRASAGGILNMTNQNLIEQIAQRLGQQAKRRAFQQRLGNPGLRRFGSESSLPGLRRSNSLSNLSQTSVKNRVQWRQSNGNLSRAASFSSMSTGVWRGRGFRRRGGRMGLVRGRMRTRAGRPQMVGRLNGQRGRRRGFGQGGVAGPPGARGLGRGARGGRGAPAGRGRGAAVGRGAGAGRGRARGRGGVVTRQQKAVPTKEELDLQLDQYMASTKSALDRELDAYMKNAMDLE